MTVIKSLAYITVALYVLANILLFVFQTKIIFHPGKLTRSFIFKTSFVAEEVFMKTPDGETINGLFFPGSRDQVILYFHGNAGDLSGWQYVAEDFLAQGFYVLIVDYRGYGKSTGNISEEGFYVDAQTAIDFLVKTKEFIPQNVIVYGRSVGSGCAVNLAATNTVGGLVLEAPYTSLGKLADEKVPFFFPSLFLRFRFDNLAKINQVRCPIIFIHGTKDELIPSHHSSRLAAAFKGPKLIVTIDGGAHNDLNSFPAYQEFLKTTMLQFFHLR